MIGLLITVFRVLPIVRLHPEQPNNQLVAGGRRLAVIHTTVLATGMKI